MAAVISLLLTLRDSVSARAALQFEMLALRHQLHVLERSRARRPRLTRVDRWLWVWLARVWQDWRNALVIVKPETVIDWHRRGFRVFWTWKSRHCLDRRFRLTSRP
jgi:putative transposase